MHAKLWSIGLRVLELESRFSYQESIVRVLYGELLIEALEQ